MDFLPDLFSLTTLAYALMGIPALFGFAVMVRLARQGRSSFSQRHKAMDQRILQTATEMDELNKIMQEGEQLHIVAAALREALLLHPQPEHISVEEKEHYVALFLERQAFFVLYREKKHMMRSTGKTVHGHGYFEVQGPVPLPAPSEPLGEGHKIEPEPQKTGKSFHSLWELEVYLSEKIQRPHTRSLPPALRKKSTL